MASNNNITITGDVTNDTFLIAHNRATTVISLGATTNGLPFHCTNVTLCNMTIEAQPHEAVSYDNAVIGYTNIYELGQLSLAIGDVQGSLIVLYGASSNQPSYNICISNCVFLHGVKSIVPKNPLVNNLLVQSCIFIPWDSNCLFYGTTNMGASNTMNTTTWQGEVCGMFGGPVNAVIVDNTYIGNSDTSELTALNTNNHTTVAPDGFIYFQQGGNYFIARNSISNYALEGVQLAAGPNSVVGNIYNTLVSDVSCGALQDYEVGGYAGADGTINPVNYSTCFIGNSVTGGRYGAHGGTTNAVLNYASFTLNVSGNSFSLFPPFAEGAPFGDYPGAAAIVQNCLSISVCGNTVASGGHGFYFSGGCSNALVLNNNFGNVAYRGIGYGSAGDFLNAAQIFGNTLGQGVSFHVQLTSSNSFGWFMGNNTCLNTKLSVVSAFLDPAVSAVHVYQ